MTNNVWKKKLLWNEDCFSKFEKMTRVHLYFGTKEIGMVYKEDYWDYKYCVTFYNFINAPYYYDLNLFFNYWSLIRQIGCIRNVCWFTAVVVFWYSCS